MRKLLRLAYRLLILNRFVRWTWLLVLVLYGVKVATDKGLAWHRTPSSKVIFTLSPSDIESFTIQNEAAEDVIFSRQDSIWIAVKNNIIVRLTDDSVRPYWTLFSRLERLAVKTLENGTARDATNGRVGEKVKWQISIFEKNGIKHLLSIYYTALDSLSNENLTFVRLNNERLLNGVRGDWQAVLTKDFDNYRDRRLLSFSVKDAVELSFQNPMDTLNFFRKDSVWHIKNNLLVDLVTVKNHIDKLDILRGSIFYDDDRDLLADRKISNRLVIKTLTDTAVITAFRLDNHFVIHSSCNPDSYFKMDSTTALFWR